MSCSLQMAPIFLNLEMKLDTQYYIVTITIDCFNQYGLYSFNYYMSWWYITIYSLYNAL